MRILVLIHEFPPVGGGGGRVAEDICRGLVQRGHEIRVLTAHLAGLPKNEKRGGIEIIRVPSMRRIAFKADFRAMLGFVVAGFFVGWSIARDWKPDVIHVHFAVPSGAVGLPISWLTRIPYILTAHLGDIPGGVPDKTDRWFRWVYPLTPPIWEAAAHNCTVSEYSRDLILKSYPVDAEVIPNGVDLDLLDPGEFQLSEVPRLVFAGRFVVQKNPLQVIRALAQLRELSWQCVMIGDGPLRKDVEVEIDRLNLRDRILLTGWVTPDEVIDWFSKSDLLFMPSLSEGLPVVGVQALAMGLAIVAGNTGGFVDLVENGTNGFLLEGKNAQAGVPELRQLLSSPKMLLSFRQASRRRSQKYDIRKVVLSYESILFQVAQTGDLVKT